MYHHEHHHHHDSDEYDHHHHHGIHTDNDFDTFENLAQRYTLNKHQPENYDDNYYDDDSDDDDDDGNDDYDDDESRMMFARPWVRDKTLSHPL